MQKKQRNILISSIVLFSLLIVSISFVYVEQQSMQTAMSIFWDNERGNIMTGAHYNIGDTIIQLDANYVYPCDTYVGMYCWLKFHLPSGASYGPFSKRMTWSCPPCQPPGNVFLIPVNINLNTWGTWSIEYQFKGREEDRGWDASPCFAGTLEFFVGAPIPCYKCEDYNLVSQNFYQETCPDGWQSTPPDCGTPPIETYTLMVHTVPSHCYVSMDGAVIESSDSGFAIFEDVETGTYTLTVSKVGYIPITDEVVLDSDKSVSYTLEQEVPETNTVLYHTSPGNIGHIILDGLVYTDGETSEELDGTYTIFAASCCGYEFEQWSTTGGLTVSGIYSESTSVSISGDGSLTATYKETNVSPTPPSTPGFELLVLIGAFCIVLFLKKRKKC